MSTAGEAERLLAAALRAQAASTPTSASSSVTSEDDARKASQPAEDTPGEAPASGTGRGAPSDRLPVAATLLLAVLLGLVAGAIVGLATLM